MALLSMRDVSVGFGGALVLENISLQIERGERLGLVGRNGVGKSTLLKIIAGELEPDAGTVIHERGLQVAYLVQDVPEGLTGSVAEILAGGLAASESSPSPNGDEDAWRRRLQMDTIVARMGLDPAADFERLSAGLKRRILLARGLVRDPDIVLLDEPTNHLDIDAIAWLEDYLLRYGGTLVFVTHDRVFLRKLATRIIEIDRGRLIDWVCDYDTFPRANRRSWRSKPTRPPNSTRSWPRRKSGSARGSRRGGRGTRAASTRWSSCAASATTAASSPAHCACRSRRRNAQGGW